MKRAIVLSLAVLMIFGVTVFATGPLLGVSVVPDPGAGATLTVGFNIASVDIELQKTNLTELDGDWSFGLLWVPQQGNFGYRAGVRLVLEYWNSAFKYDGFEFVVGVSNTWGPIQLYFDANIAPTQALGIVPIVGINILFGELIPDVEL